jgi:hypothetical protein
MKAFTVVLLLALQASIAHGQTVATEVDVTGGASTEGIGAVATQVRTLGSAVAGVKFFVELSWAARTEDAEGDAFEGAYPYGNRLQVTEAYAERLFKPGAGLFGVRAGRYRSPFGIYSRSDNAYTGFLRPPMIRDTDSFGLSNGFLEHGAELIAGTPEAYVETSVGAPADVGEAHRRSGVDTVTRGQVYYRGLIVGASYFRSQPYSQEITAVGHTAFTGVDARWMWNGVQLRGEWITGRPFDGTTTEGGYLDLFVHRVGMGPVTAIARLERLDHETPDEDEELASRRVTVGARIRLPGPLTVQVNMDHQWPQASEGTPTTFSVAFTYSMRHDAVITRP